MTLYLINEHLAGIMTYVVANSLREAMDVYEQQVTGQRIEQIRTLKSPVLIAQNIPRNGPYR